MKWGIANLTKIPRKGIYGTKPINPVIGEIFHCTYDHQDSQTEFIAEQVSHHPPISALYMKNEKLGFACSGHFDINLSFCGNYLSVSNDSKFKYLTNDRIFILH